MPRLEVIAEGIIYRNPNPGYEYVFASHSHVVQISERELLCAYMKGQAMYAVDLEFAQARSTDGGVTWQEEPLIYDPSQDDLPYSYHDPFLGRLNDGTLIIVAFRTERTDPKMPMFNEATGGVKETETVIFRSSDNGYTWSGPESPSFPPDLIITPTNTVLELPNGQWFLPFDQWHGFDDPGPYRPRTVGLFSSDQGRTWGDAVTYADGAEQGKGFWHGKTIPLADGRLFSLYWSADMKNNLQTLPLHRNFGSPDARSWSAPEATNIPGQTNWPVDLGDGRMAAIYTNRESDTPGFFVTFSQDEGKTWDIENQICVWDATGRDKLGVSAPDSYPRSHDTIAFGAPTSMRLLNGEILVSFWCTEMSITHIRYARLQVV